MAIIKYICPTDGFMFLDFGQIIYGTTYITINGMTIHFGYSYYDADSHTANFGLYVKKDNILEFRNGYGGHTSQNKAIFFPLRK